MTDPALSHSPAKPIRAFGRFELRRLLGKSAGTMVWLAFDPRGERELMLTLPRVQPAGPVALENWLRDARFAARLDHPNLARPVEVGVQDQWPFVAVDRALGVTLGEWLAQHPNPTAVDAAGWGCDLLQGLAFAHEAGVAHRDPQLHAILIDDRGTVRLMALAALGATVPMPSDATTERSHERAMALDPNQLRAQRDAAARDVLASGLLLHRLLCGQPALDQPDTALVIARAAPLGREVVRLPWSTPLPIPEALRAIVNRATSHQERLRYHNARTLLGALAGWVEAQSHDGGGPIALLLDRLRTVGHLPALPGLAARVERVANLEGQRTDELAAQVLDDMALSFELLRTLNSSQVQSTQVQGNGPVLTLRRIISLIGVDGVRAAANTLRGWPGPLSPAQAAALQITLDQVRLAGHTAQALRPAGYDAQVVYLIAVLQNLGRLMLRYHFADEAAQIVQLTQSASAQAEPGAPEQAGLSEVAAAYAVLGVDIESLGAAVASHWGLDEDVQHMVRRLPPGTPVRKADSDAEVLRIVASAANEVVDAWSQLPAARVGAGLTQVAQRYARVLGVNGRDMQEALQAAREMLSRQPAEAAARTAKSARDEPAASSLA
jgi:non-specific serine/threonine protein kinase